MRKEKYKGVGKSWIGIVLLGLPILVHYLFPVKIVIMKPFNYMGCLLLISAVILAIKSAGIFKDVGNDYSLSGEKGDLITYGPFKYSRNPIYLSMLLCLLGLSIILGSVSSFIFPTIFFLFANCMIIPMEEKNLQDVFGREFILYKQEVRRWI